MQDIFFVTDPATTKIYTLSLHDALPIWAEEDLEMVRGIRDGAGDRLKLRIDPNQGYAPEVAFPLARDLERYNLEYFEQPRSEEHTSELQSRRDLVCRLLLEKKKTMSADT